MLLFRGRHAQIMDEHNTAHFSRCFTASSGSCDENESPVLITRYESDRRYTNINVKYQKICYTLKFTI